MRRIKPTEYNVYKTEAEVDVEDLTTKVAEKVGKVIAQEIVEALKAMSLTGPRRGQASAYDEAYNGPQMDESVIPLNVQTQAQDVNLEGMVSEHAEVDKELQGSKSKLKGILKKRKNKE